MSILIKGREMPECCDECVFMEIQDNGFGNDYICSISKEDVDGVCDCPLIEIPDGHGRLIDADALINLVNRCIFPSDMATTLAVSMTVNWVKEAPTVLPSDKDGET